MLKNTKKHQHLLSKLRPVIQGVFFIFFLYLFLRISYPLNKNIADNFFFNFDPLIALVMVLTGTALTTAIFASILLVIFTVLFGRIFCGWICPMGTVFDLCAMIMPKKKVRKPFGSGVYKNIKYYILIFLLSGSIFGFSAVIFLDPIVFLFRVTTLNIYPFVILISNQFLNLTRPLAMKLGFFELSLISFEQPVFKLGLASLLIFLTAVGLIAVERRFWCRNLCPLGALLAVLSRFSIRGRNVSEECIDCSKCAQACPMNAIDNDFRLTSIRECIQCERCSPVCPVDAISFSKVSPGEGTAFNPGRRSLIYSGIGGVLTGLTAGLAATTATTSGTLLRPPGALIEKDFLDACLRCGECMKVCPTHGLQPAMFQSGFEGIFTPVLTPRIGACEEQCNLCGQICPVGAIRNLSLEEKQYAVIGNATIERNLCIAWEQGKVCLICDEVCPYDAVEFSLVTDEVGSIKRPFVIEDKCVGCGQCEKGCPVNGPAAIHVTPVNEVRKNSGTYITEKVKQLREVKDDYVDFSKETGVQGEETRTVEPIPETDDFDDDMPAGFIK